MSKQKQLVDADTQRWLERLKGKERYKDYLMFKGDSNSPPHLFIKTVIYYLGLRAITHARPYVRLNRGAVPVMFHHQNKIYCVIHPSKDYGHPGIARDYTTRDKRYIMDECASKEIIVFEATEDTIQSIIDAKFPKPQIS
jgi:hypothetical protein